MTISKDTLEQLSEFVDGQGKRETGMFFAKRLSADSELQAVWSRYHLIRECVRHRGAHGQAVYLQNRVATAIAEEPEPGIEAMQAQAAWLRPVVGLAITAVVAVTAVIAVQNSEVQPGQVSDLQATASPAAAFSTPESNGLEPAANQAVPVSYKSMANQNSQRLNAYLLRHNQVVARTGRGGVIYLAPIVSAQNATAPNQTSPLQDKAGEPAAEVAEKLTENPEPIAEK